MFGIHWNGRPTRASEHPLADPVNAARLIAELPAGSPASAVAEAAAWLESVEAEGFVANHRLNVVSMIDEAVRGSVDELTLGYLGAAPGNPGQASDWRVLTEYLDRLCTAYGSIIEACAERRNADLLPRIPLVMVRAMRAISLGMKVSWLRYLPPDRASWEGLVRTFRTARGRSAATAMITAYPTEKSPTCVLHELAVAVMLAGAAPQNLTPRQVEVAYRVTTAQRARFTSSPGGDHRQCRHYLFDLDRAGAPARIPEQTPLGADVMLFSAEAVVPPLQAIVERGRSGGGVAAMADADFGTEFGSGEKLHVLEHLLRFWDDSPPERREERRRVNTRIHVEVGVKAIHAALDRREHPQPPDNDLCMLEIAVDKPAAAVESPVTPINTWMLTDFSARGIGARFTRRLDRWLKIGSLVAFKLERSNTWCVAIVRRLRTDARNQTDVGCEILAKNAELVALEGNASAAAFAELEGTGPLVHTSALMLPHDPQLHSRASLLFEPGTNAPGQSFTMHHGATRKRIRLRSVVETLDGWDRVEFDALD